MVKILIVILLMLQATAASACERDIYISYPPFVNLLTINKFFYDFHGKLQLKTGCKIKYVLNKDFAEVVDGLLLYKHEIAVLPGAYIPIAKELGYQLVASMVRENLVFLVARKEFQGEDFSDLSGKNIMILGDYSESGAIFINAMEDNNMLSKVRIKNGLSYERMLLSVMKGVIDLAVVIPEYWKSFSPEVRDNNLKIVQTFKAGAAGMMTLPDSEAFSKDLYEVLSKEKAVKWGVPQESYISLPLLEAFIKDQVKQGMEP